jgi:hypothetical protein
MQPQRFVMMDINPYSYNVVIWITSQLSGVLNTWWLNCTWQAAIRGIRFGYIAFQDVPPT